MLIKRYCAIIFLAFITLCLCACAPGVGNLSFEAPEGFERDKGVGENKAMYLSSSFKGSICITCNNTTESDLTEDNFAKLREELIEGANVRGKAEIAEEGKITAGGCLWLKMSFSYPENGSRWSYFMTRVNHKTYFFLLVCPDSEYETLKPVFEKTVNSAKFN